ncbi:MAG TPA: sigma 54-interacting transcriptional regulator [Candidatus Polarisedimenticolaceae bacterium]|nr:sigma 54-interacting transcriptional regulator [Candidatus Polarisedimenticolaceae bacterium]
MDASTIEAGGFTDPSALENVARLQALRRTFLLDSPPEGAFDRLTTLATSLLRVPVAYVALLDDRRQFFKSQVGLPEPLARARQTPLSQSFCKHVVESREALLVADARVHPDLRDNPAVSEHGLVAYAGVPLITSDGHALGTFCVLDRTPHAWTEEEIGVLRELASSAISEIELRRLAGELSTLSTSLQAAVDARTAELRTARERQRVLLEVNNAVVTCLDRGSLFQAAVAALGRVIPFDRAALVLHDPARDVFTVLGSADPSLAPPIAPLRPEWPREGSRSGWAFDHDLALVTADMREPPCFLEHAFLLERGFLSAVTVPLRIKGKAVGTLNVVSRTAGRYGEEDASLLLAIGEQMALAIENLLAYEEIAALKARLEEEKLYLQEEARTEFTFGDVVGESRGIQQVLAGVRKVADTDSTVLVTGETGTGKELIVGAIHDLSRRKDKILVKVNCAALPAGVIESELFGHEKGAFTGALTRKIGRFELAHGGTLFLDEVGDLPLDLQAKLLRVLQEGEFERVGGTQTLKVNVRLVAATNRDLEAAVSEGRFRADLFYRLNVFPLHIPPLRQRLDDVPRLVRHFIMLYAAKMGKKIGAPSAEVLSRLRSYHWPGNVRELQNVIERAVILASRGRLEPSDVLVTPAGREPKRTDRSLEEVERRHVLSVLEETGWRVGGERGAARILGMKRTTLEARMKKLGIQRPSHPGWLLQGSAR